MDDANPLALRPSARDEEKATTVAFLAVRRWFCEQGITCRRILIPDNGPS